MKKRWIVLPMAVALLAIGAVTMGAALAHTGTNGDLPMSSFASRVAAILGLDEAQVQDAMDQARKELRDEVVESKLNTWVEQGRITQEQADAQLEWYKSRPDDFPGFGRGHGRHHGFKHGVRGFGRGGPATESAPSAEGTTQ